MSLKGFLRPEKMCFPIRGGPPYQRPVSIYAVICVCGNLPQRGTALQKRMLENQLSPIEIKISTVVAVSVLLRSLKMEDLDQALQRFTGGTPDYFENEFAVLDVAACDFVAGPPDWSALIALFKSFGLNPVAVRHAPSAWEADIIEQGLSIDAVGQMPAPLPQLVPAPAAEASAATESAIPKPPAMPEALPALVIDTPVRAGQRIYARGRDLVVTAVVNSGAELIADGSIHVYAPLRGRALAGANGNAEARIFAFSMEAELVSIAGTYRTFEDGIPSGLKQKPTQVRLAGDHIDLSPLIQLRT